MQVAPSVAGEHGVAVGEQGADAGDKAGGGAGVHGVDDILRHLGLAVQAGDCPGVGLLVHHDLSAEGPGGRHRGQAVLGGQRVVNDGGALRQHTEHDAPDGTALGAGDSNFSGEGTAAGIRVHKQTSFPHVNFNGIWAKMGIKNTAAPPPPRAGGRCVEDLLLPRRLAAVPGALHRGDVGDDGEYRQHQ